MTAATPGQPAPVSPHLGCAVCASGVTVPHGAGGTPGQAALPPLPPKWTGKFRKLPIVIEAVQLTNENIVDVMRWVAPAAKIGQAVDVTIDIDKGLTVATLEGDMTASFGDWVIRGVKGEFYPCKPDIFDATYEPAAQEPHAAPELAGLRGALVDAIVRWSGRDALDQCASELAAILDQHQEPTGAKPAPELAAAMRETGEVREGYARLCEEFGDSPQSGQSARISLTVLNRHRKAAGLSARRPAPAGERRDAFMQMREKLDAMADLTAGMHAEADKTAPPGSEPDPEDTARAQVLHEYAARIRQLLEA